MNYKIDDDKSHIDHVLVHQWLQHCSPFTDYNRKKQGKVFKTWISGNS